MGLNSSFRVERFRERETVAVGVEAKVGTDGFVGFVFVFVCILPLIQFSLLSCSRNSLWGYLAGTRLGVVGGSY